MARSKKMQTCNICNEVFFGQKNFKEHLSSSPKCATYKCQFCSFCCQDEVTLKKHISNKAMCSQKMIASSESGFVHHYNNFGDLKEANNDNLNFPSDIEIADFSKKHKDLMYEQIISQIIGTERLSYDVSTNNFTSVTNTVVDSHSKVKKKKTFVV